MQYHCGTKCNKKGEVTIQKHILCMFNTDQSHIFPNLYKVQLLGFYYIVYYHYFQLMGIRVKDRLRIHVKNCAKRKAAFEIINLSECLVYLKLGQTSILNLLFLSAVNSVIATCTFFSFRKSPHIWQT